MSYMTEADFALARGLCKGTIHDIVAEVSVSTGIPPSQIMGRSRLAPVADARALCMFIARRQGFSLSRIGKSMNRDHTTVLAAIRKMTQRAADIQKEEAQ